jgi:hypothetical protein
VEGVTQTVAPAVRGASGTVDGVTQAVAPVTTGAAPVMRGAGGVVDGATQAAAPAVHAAEPLTPAGGSARGVVEAVGVAPAPPPVAEHVMAGGGALAPDPTTAALSQTTAATPTGAGHAAAADGLAQVATDPRLIAVAGISALAGTAYVAVRGAGCVAGGDPGVILNNVRMIPCLARTTASSTGTALATFGMGARTAVAGLPDAARAGLGGLEERASREVQHVKDAFAAHVADPFRDGFERGTGGLDGRGDSGGGDLLLLGLGLVVGLIYAAVLSVWLFATGARQGDTSA